MSARANPDVPRQLARRATTSEPHGRHARSLNQRFGCNPGSNQAPTIGGSFLPAKQHAREPTRDHGTYDLCHPEEPQLLECPTAYEECRPGATRRIYRRVRHRDADEVDQRETAVPPC